MQDAKDSDSASRQSIVDVVGITREDELARTSGTQRMPKKRMSSQLFRAFHYVLDDLEGGVRVLSRKIRIDGQNVARSAEGPLKLF
jgi:hypothetical protein